MAHMSEATFVEEVDENLESLKICINAIQEILLSLVVTCDKVVMESNTHGTAQGIDGEDHSKFTWSVFHSNFQTLFSLSDSQRWAVFHASCIGRFLYICNGFIESSVASDDNVVVTVICSKLKLCIQIIRLIRTLTKYTTNAEFYNDLLQAVVSFANSLLGLFRTKMEIVNFGVVPETSFESLLILALEEFLLLCRLIFCNSCVFINIRAWIIASIFENLDTFFWTSSGGYQINVPLACFPQSVTLTFKLIDDVTKQTYQFVDWKELTMDKNSGSAGTEADSSASVVHHGRIRLLKKYTVKELLQIVFPSGKQWVNNLFHLVSFLHSEGVRLGMKMENSSAILKGKNEPAVENSSIPEEDALFGNLFYESVRSSDVYDSSSSAGIPVSCNYNTLLHAVTELLRFIKDCIFSPETYRFLYDDGCKKLTCDNVGVLLSVLNCRACHSGNYLVRSDADASECRKTGNVHDLCFDILYNLLTSGGFPRPLDRYLVDGILKIENGVFVYNNMTLVLLAHSIICRGSKAGHQLRNSVLHWFVDYVVDKSEYVLSDCRSLKKLVEILPSLFHMEILLMALHLSSPSERSSFESYILSSMRKMLFPSPCSSSTQLSCWALFTSRILVVIRYLVFFPQSTPSSLLLDLKSRLNEFSASRTHASNSSVDHLFSWTSITAKTFMGEWVSDDPFINTLLHQFIDVEFVNTPLSTNEALVQTSKHSLLDMCTTFSKLWNGRKVASVEDLLIERYVFSLCWDVVILNPEMGHSLHHGREGNTSSIDLVFQLSNLLLGHGRVKETGSIQFSDVVRLFGHLNVTLSDSLMEINWDFFRAGLCTSLLLSILNHGVVDYCAKNLSLSLDVDLSGNGNCPSLSENLVCEMFEVGHVEGLIEILSSLLKKYLNVYHKSFVASLEKDRNSDKDFSLSLLKHTEFDKNIQALIIGKIGANTWQVESLCNLALKAEEIIRSGVPRFMLKHFSECMLHGFPSQLNTSSGVFVSSILNVKRIITVLYGIFRVITAKGSFCTDFGVHGHVLEAVMDVKSDRVFEALSGKCSSIFCSFIGGPEKSCYSYLFSLKKMENILRQAGDCCESRDVVHDFVIARTVDIMETLFKDSSLREILNFFFGFDSGVEQINELCGSQRGDLQVLFDCLDKRVTDPVNIKLLNFFVSLLSVERYLHLKQKIQKKFLSMEASDLSGWLMERLLHGTVMVDSSLELNSEKCNYNPLRDSTIHFISCILSTSDLESANLHDHLFDAFMISLDTAFLQFDIHRARAYFAIVVQLARKEHFVKLLINKIFSLTESFNGGDEHLLQKLKFLYNFVATALTDSISCKTGFEKLSLRSFSSDSLCLGFQASRSECSRKSSETLALSTNQEGGITSSECDAVFFDDDDEFGTSDGELHGLDRDEDDVSNNERALATKVCTFTSSGSNFMEQHWYFCYTCDLTVSKGCCSVCAKVCHRGHRVAYSRSSRFFCDCGAGGAKGSSCQCLTPRSFSGSNNDITQNARNFESLNVSEEAYQLPETDSDIDEDTYMDSFASAKLVFPKEFQDGLLTLLREVDAEGHVIRFCSSMLSSVLNRKEAGAVREKNIVIGEHKVVSHGFDLLQLIKAYKSGFIDLKVKADYPSGKELKSHLANGSLVKSLLSVSARGRLAVGEGDKIVLFDMGQLIGQSAAAPIAVDKTSMKPLSKNFVRFEIVQLIFNPTIESYLAVAGYEDCHILTVNSRGEVTDRLPIELSLQGAYIRGIEWVPGTQTQLMVVTNKYVKIYDLSLDNISPVHYLTVPGDTIVDATFASSFLCRLFLIILTGMGCLLKFELKSDSTSGMHNLRETILMNNGNKPEGGSSLHFSAYFKLLFISYKDGSTLVGRLNPSATCISDVSPMYEVDQDAGILPAGLHHWRELLHGGSLFACYSSVKSESALVLSFGHNEVYTQNIKKTVGTNSQSVGISAYRLLSKDEVHIVLLQDDGSLHIYSYSPVGIDGAVRSATDKIKELRSRLLSNEFVCKNPVFPLDFFERTVCITPDVKMGTDSVINGDIGVKQKLSSEDGFLESPDATGFKITISNSNPGIVMVGFRVHVGNTSSNNIPSDISVFQRVVKLDEGMRAWYDIPFTNSESLLADEEFTISIGPAFSPSSLSRIDSLEVYGRTKDEFGWREKMDAVLGTESRITGCTISATNVGRRRFSVQSAPIDEQVLADGLKLLSRFYLLSRVHGILKPEEGKTDLSKFKCTDILEVIFQSDREPLLQASACAILHSLFPNREIYYQVKDALRLFGVVKSSAVLKSKLDVGSITMQSVVEQLTTQIHAVSKIALHRRLNLTRFLEMNGSGVVDGLLEILFEIVDLGQVDSQTLSNLVIPSVDLIFCYAECLALHAKESDELSVASPVSSLKRLLFSNNTVVQSSCSLAIASRLLQVPFPKQVTVVSDSVPDGSVSIVGPSETVVGNENIQAMIEEEDTSTSSVQYCCDGCSTVPIFRRRWHCTICPDFDLCETCYEVLDADQLPAPHSRDHPMSAVPIETESVVDHRELHINASDVRPPAADTTNLPNPLTAIHVLDPSAAGGFPPAVSDPSLFSASKQALNSLVLAQLLEHMKGWMGSTVGIHAIPIMQLFYRLSAVCGGYFIDTSRPDGVDMEKLVRWFLEEINIGNPFVSHSRSTFGEVVILVFMFFTLMLRSHAGCEAAASSRSTAPAHSHEKGLKFSTSTTPTSGGVTFYDYVEKDDSASRLLKACGRLRHQAFVNYLVDILQKLIHVFKSPSNLGSVHGPGSIPGCGSLLMVWKDLPAGSFSPFFSDSYAKSRSADVFTDYHRLLLENTFRLLYSLVRPERHDKNGEREKIHKNADWKEIKLDGFNEVFCFYINSPHTSFVRRYARKLFLFLCGSRTHYYSVRDSWQFSTENSKLYKHVKKSGGAQTPVSYERRVKMVKCLSSMAEVASTRPWNWQKYCLRHGEVLPFLLSSVFHFEEVSAIQALGLLNLAFYTGKDAFHFSFQKPGAGETGVAGDCLNKSGSQSSDSKKRKNEAGAESGSDKVSVDMESAVEVFTGRGMHVLHQFIDRFLLESNSVSVRTEAKFILHGVFHHGTQSFKETLLLALLKKIHLLPAYGQNIVEYTELMTWLFGKVFDQSQKQASSDILDCCLNNDLVNSIFGTLRSQNKLLANHPNSRIYNTLSGLIEFEGFYLESEPCVSCTSPDLPYVKMKLETLKSETKFTDNRILVKCSGNYTIQSVTMTVHDARKSKSVKSVNLYYNNVPVTDLSELKNNWLMWKRAKSCSLALNQMDVKVEFSVPITACNFMIELDSFYENFQALSLEPLQCPRCSRPVTDKHGNCGNCHENAYQCRQCRNINYENLNSFLCNECGYSKYGRFEFSFMAKPSFRFDEMENDEDMRRGLAAIECESENAHRRYQQLLGFKKPILKIVSSIGESDMDSQQKDSVQQIMVSLPGPSCKINRKIALLSVLYGEKCKTAFDSVSKSIQTLQGLRKVLVNYLNRKPDFGPINPSNFVVSDSPNSCYGCASTFVTQCLELLHVLSKHPNLKKIFVAAGVISELFENNIHQGPRTTRLQARAVLCAFSEGDQGAVTELNNLINKKILYSIEHHRSVDIPTATREELSLLSEVCSLADDFWESRLRVVFRLFFMAIKVGAQHPVISEYVVLPCLRIILRECTLPKPEAFDREHETGTHGGLLLPSGENRSGSPRGTGNGVDSGISVRVPPEKKMGPSGGGEEIHLLSYSEWDNGGTYLDFVRRQYKVSQADKGYGPRLHIQRRDYLDLKYALKWKRATWRRSKSGAPMLELGTWVKELVMCRCSQSVRLEMCMLVGLLCSHSLSRKLRLLDLMMNLLPATLTAGETAAEYFDLLFKIVDSEDACLFLTVRGHLTGLCNLITKEVGSVEVLEKNMRIDISLGFILHKLVILLGKFLEVPNIRARFMRDNMLFEIFDAFIIIQGLLVQKTKLINDCNKILKDLLDSLLLESSGNKTQFIRACIHGLKTHGEARMGRNSMFILDHICNLICPSKPEPVYLLILNKAHTQEEFIRGSMTKNPYSSVEIGPLMRDVKNKICHQLELLGLLEDDYGMELLVTGNIISLDLSISQVYEQVWKKTNLQSSPAFSNTSLISSATPTSRDYPPMPVTYRLQGLDGEATEPMIKELDEDRDECKDPEVEFAIAATVREFGGFEIILGMIQRLQDDLGSNQEQMLSVLNLLMNCCKIRGNRQALLRLGALSLLLETARRAFYVDAMELAESVLIIVESLTVEANDSEGVYVTHDDDNPLSSAMGEGAASGEQAKKIILMFLERVCHPPLHLKKSSRQQRNTEMVTRILPYLTYGEPAAMEALIGHFEPYLKDWGAFDRLSSPFADGSEEEAGAARQRFALESFVRMSESMKTSSCGGRLKDIVLDRGITELAVGHLRDSFPAITEKASLRSAAGLKLPSVPLILSMLGGLSLGHVPTQVCVDEGGLLPLLHAMEGVAGENEIGAKAENLLDTLSGGDGEGGGGFLREKVQRLRHSTREEMRSRALRRREEMLQGLGMRQEGGSGHGGRIVVDRPLLQGIEDVEEEEEDGIACMVCREGYNLRPADILGVYSYSKWVKLGMTPRGDGVLTTVSHFNVIHFQCHLEAKRADSALKTPKKEWEGATLRNNETLCNSLFPIYGPSVAPIHYSQCVDQYWENINALGRTDGSRLRLITYDIVLLVARFATGASFSTDSKGGGRESNCRFLPFMVQMGLHLADQGSPSDRAAAAQSVQTYLSGSSQRGGVEETVQFMMVSSLLSEPYGRWVEHRRAFLGRGIRHAYMQWRRQQQRRQGGDPPGEEDVLAVVKPMLVYTGVVERLHTFFRESAAEEDVKGMLDMAVRMLTWLDELAAVTRLDEAFRASGLLAEVLGFGGCGEFVKACVGDCI